MTTPARVEFTVRPGQVFVPCVTYAWDPPSTFIVEAVAGDRVSVVIPFGGGRHHPNGRHRSVALKSLHATGTTAQGRERRTGWRLHTEAPSNPGLWLCGSCWSYFDREDLAVAAYGPASSTCIPCMAAIDKEYA